MSQEQNSQVSKSDVQKCIICEIHETKQIDLALILAQLINSLKQILENKSMLSQKIINRNAFGDLIKCVFNQKEAFSHQSSICVHQSLKIYVCSRFECNQEQLIKAAQIKGLQIAKRMYELQLIKAIAKNSINTICDEPKRQIKPEKIKKQKNQYEMQNEVPYLIASSGIEIQRVKQMQYQRQKQLKIEHPQQHQQNNIVNSNFSNFANFQFNMQNQNGFGFPFPFGNQFHGFY